MASVTLTGNNGDHVLPEGWHCPTSEERDLLLAELQRELPKDHLLFNIPVSAYASAGGIDDVLYRHSDDPDRFTVIHLSWLGRTEINSLHPTVEYDGTFAGFLDWHQRFLDFASSITMCPCCGHSVSDTAVFTRCVFCHFPKSKWAALADMNPLRRWFYLQGHIRAINMLATLKMAGGFIAMILFGFCIIWLASIFFARLVY